MNPRPGGINHQIHSGDETSPGGPYQTRGEFLEVTPPSRIAQAA